MSEDYISGNFQTNQKKSSLIVRTFELMLKRHWWIIGFLAVLLFVLEFYEIKYEESDLIHLLEYSTYLSFLLILGILRDLLMRSMIAQNRAIKILDYRHKLSLELAIDNEWNSLVERIAKFPSTITDCEETWLFVRSSIGKQFEAAAYWSVDGRTPAEIGINPVCETCTHFQPGIYSPLNECSWGKDVAVPSDQSQGYCLPIRYGNELLAVVRFRIKPGKKINDEQIEILKNVSDEIGSALKGSQEHKILAEFRSSEAVLAERRTASHDLHDNLGQNLAYLRLKTDQLIVEKDLITKEILQKDLERMREVANDSYEIVRGTLETNLPATKPLLSNLLMEHARKVSQRANFEVEFHTIGQPSSISTDIQRALFYVFQEALNNVEKHARASKVVVTSEWSSDHLNLTIADNGTGFNPGSVNTNEHFGLEIVHERIEKVNGRITLTSLENSGTTLEIWIPISS